MIYDVHEFSIDAAWTMKGRMNEGENCKEKKILKRNKYQQEAREEETRNHEKKNSED